MLYLFLIITALITTNEKIDNESLQFKIIDIEKILLDSRIHNDSSTIIQTKDIFLEKGTTTFKRDWYSDSSLNKSLIPKNYTNWMKKINDKTPLNKLSIPGTHDTCTYAFIGPKILQYIIKLLGATQSWDLEEQLYSGIRFFDIRLGSDSNIYHGILQTTSNFTHVLSSFVNYLNNNPSEGIIMRLQYNEVYYCQGNECFMKNVINVLNKYKKYLFLSKNIPTLGEIRGKIFIICEFMEYENAMDWNDIKLDIQDYWEFKGRIKEEYNKKIKLIKEFFGKSINSNNVIINHISASGFYSLTTIKDIAYVLNEIPYNETNFKGIIPMDFQSESLVLHIIDRNFYCNKNNKFLG